MVWYVGEVSVVYYFCVAVMQDSYFADQYPNGVVSEESEIPLEEPPVVEDESGVVNAALKTPGVPIVNVNNIKVFGGGGGGRREPVDVPEEPTRARVYPSHSASYWTARAASKLKREARGVRPRNRRVPIIPAAAVDPMEELFGPDNPIVEEPEDPLISEDLGAALEIAARSQSIAVSAPCSMRVFQLEDVLPVSLAVQVKVAAPLVEVVSLVPIEIVDEEPLSDYELTLAEALEVSLF